MIKKICLALLVLLAPSLSYAKYLEISQQEFKIYIFDTEVDFHGIDQGYDDLTILYSTDDDDQMEGLQELLSNEKFFAVKYMFRDVRRLFVFTADEDRPMRPSFLQQLGPRIHVIEND